MALSLQPKIVPAPVIPHQPFQMRGGSLTALVLRLREVWQTDHATILADAVGRAPGFYRSAPLVFDLRDLAQMPPEQVAGFSFEALTKAARAAGLIPVAVQNGDATLNALAASAGLAIAPALRAAPLPSGPSEQSPPLATKPAEPEATVAATPEPESEPAEPTQVKTTIIRQPVRSGQMVRALGDLVVLSSVSPGAELVAGGHIHVYGALRGRALAGALGDENAMIYAQNFDAELVAIAGIYQIAEGFDDSLRGKRICIALRNEELAYETLP